MTDGSVAERSDERSRGEPPDLAKAPKEAATWHVSDLGFHARRARRTHARRPKRCIFTRPGAVRASSRGPRRPSHAQHLRRAPASPRAQHLGKTTPIHHMHAQNTSHRPANDRATAHRHDQRCAPAPPVQQSQAQKLPAVRLGAACSARLASLARSLARSNPPSPFFLALHQENPDRDSNTASLDFQSGLVTITLLKPLAMLQQAQK